jgi:hypothetical protein
LEDDYIPGVSPRIKYFFHLLLWTVLSGVAPLPAATGVSPWFARTWLTEHGLPDNNVTGVAQSADGYLWVGTHNGLARFDGLQFDKIPLPVLAGRSELLIRTLLMVDNEQLWLAAEGGVVIRLSPNSTNVFTTADGLPNFRPMSMAQDLAGAIWVGYADGSACEIAHGAVKRFYLPGSGTCSLAADAGGPRRRVSHEPVCHAADPAGKHRAAPGGARRRAVDLCRFAPVEICGRQPAGASGTAHPGAGRRGTDGFI